MVSARILISVTVINIGYCFEGSFRPLQDYLFVSELLSGNKQELGKPELGNRFISSWLGAIPVPFPKNFVGGMDLQRKDFEAYDSPFYLNGKWSTVGWWYYYLYALAIKVPVGTLLLLALPMLAPYRHAISTRFSDVISLASTPLALFAFVSLQTGINEHFRYVLPIFPFLYIWISRLITEIHVLNTSYYSICKSTVLCIAFVWTLASGLQYYPHNLSYFNELVGGPENGAKHLLGSNLDWGQDLLLLDDWISKHSEARPIQLHYYGILRPEIVGITAHNLARTQFQADADSLPAIKWIAISINHLYDDEYLSSAQLPPELSRLKPHDTIGYTIYVYRLPK
jgi:hypothetical protein